MTSTTPRTIAAKAAATALLIAGAEIAVDGSTIGAMIGVFAGGWLGALLWLRPATLRSRAARLAAVAAATFALLLIDDPSPLAAALFLVAVSLAALLPHRRFDDAAAWGWRLVCYGFAGILQPLRDTAALAAARRRRARTGGVRAMLAALVLPIGGGAVFVALFAGANPLIGQAFATIALPDMVEATWRSVLAVVLLVPIWASLRRHPRSTGLSWDAPLGAASLFAPGIATLLLSLVTFNAIFAVENVLDVVFLWSGAALPAGVTMADYAHRGAYSLIATALLAGLFVVVALRPSSPGAASPAVRRLVALWIAQNLLLVASSALRTLDYVDAYGMTVLRLAALLWMVLVAAGLALIGWRLVRARSTAWLINGAALAATVTLTVASIVDLGATAAAWNARIALAKGRNGPPLDLCYLARLGPSALTSLAMLERGAANPALRDRLAYLRWQIQSDLTDQQRNWRSWTWRDARRLGAVEGLAGARAPHLRPAPLGRSCDGAIVLPDPPAPLTRTAQP